MISHKEFFVAARLHVLMCVLNNLEKLSLDDLLKVVGEFGFSVRSKRSIAALCGELKTEAGILYQQASSNELEKMDVFIKRLAN